MPQTEDLFVLQRPSTLTHHKLSWANLVADVGTSAPSENPVYVGETPPPDPHEGDLWYQPSTDLFQLYLVDTTDGAVNGISIRNGGSGYQIKENVPTVGGNGHELRIDISAIDGVGKITGLSIAADGQGHGYEVGDVIFLFDDGHANGSVLITSTTPILNGRWQPITSNVLVSDTPPTSANEGDLYWDTGDARMFIYVTSVGAPSWVPTTPVTGGGLIDIDGGIYA